MSASAGYKRPESILVVIYTAEGQVLLLNRTRPHGFWQSVTGSLERDELPCQTAAREVYEETGIKTDKIRDCQQQNTFTIRPEWRDRYAPQVTENIEHVFTLQLDTPVDIQLNPEEHSEYRWLPYKQAAEQVFSWSNRDVILGLF
jgi:dATP pyrophosphohydrolase